MTTPPTSPLRAAAPVVRQISPEEHLAFIRGVAPTTSVSFLQTPAWAKVKPEWGHESLGWFDGDQLVGVGLVLYRRLPRLKRSLAYLPEGPVLPWDVDDLGAWLQPMAKHLKSRGAFAVRMGPPVVTARWSAAQIKEGVSDPAVSRLTQLAPEQRSATGAGVVSALHALGWQPQSVAGGFAAGQPQYNFWVPLTVADGDTSRAKTEAEVLASMNQLWRRNIKKADKAGVVVTRLLGAPVDGGSEPTTERAIAPADLAAFHELYAHTAERDHFTPRPASYFTTMVSALAAEEPDRITLYLAHHDGDLVAATIAIRVGLHAWYSYGASSTEKRDVRGSNAVQWAMIRDALAAGAEIYDMRGITDTLDADDPHVGLIQFKVGTGGEAVEYVGEWDLPLNRLLYAAFQLYLKRRG